MLLSSSEIGLGCRTMLIVFAGLPGTGKSTIARTLACEIGAVWLRIDSIEQGIRDSGVVPGSLDDAGYRAAYAVAEDNLRLGLTIIGDSVNDSFIVRSAWRDAGLRAGARVVEVEIICSDLEEHRRRVEERSIDVPGLILPDWEETIRRDYHPWDREHVVIDTSGRSVEACVAQIRAVLNTPDRFRRLGQPSPTS
jgi:predicted kinase